MQVLVPVRIFTGMIKKPPHLLNASNLASIPPAPGLLGVTTTVQSAKRLYVSLKMAGQRACLPESLLSYTLLESMANYAPNLLRRLER